MAPRLVSSLSTKLTVNWFFYSAALTALTLSSLKETSVIWLS